MKCPCCDQELRPTKQGYRLLPFAHTVERDGVLVRLSPTQFEIFRVLSHGARALPELAEAVYAGAFQPANSHNCVAVIATFANKKLKTIGLRVGADARGRAPLWKISNVA